MCDEVPTVPVFHGGSVMDRYSKSQIKGGFSAAEIMALGNVRSQERKLEIQEIKAKIREERIAREAATQRAREALAIAHTEKAENEKLRAEIQALKKAKFAVSEADV